MASVVLGGGISGLSAAFYISKSSKNGITLYESSQRLGGWIKSTKTENGTIFEHGPRTLRCRGPAAENTLQLVKELGLTPSIRPVHKNSEAAKKRMIYFNNQLIPLPSSLKALFKIDPPFIKPFVHAIFNDLVTPKKTLTDESIYEFVARRFGKDYADIPVSAMVCGIFAGDAREISVKALMNDLFEKEQQYGSVIGGIMLSLKNKILKTEEKVKKNLLLNKEIKEWSVWSLENGLESLPICLTTYLRNQNNVDIRLGKRCSNIEFKNDKVLLTIDGKVETAEHLYSTLPSKDLAQILGDKYCFLKKELRAIPFVDVAVVNLEYEGNLLEEKGFGFLVPPNQNLPILGIIFDSCIFSQEGKTVLTVMMGGRWFEHHFGYNPEKSLLLKVATDQVESILKIRKEPKSNMVNIMKNCIPQYVVGHSERIQRIRNYITEHNLPLTLIGNSFDGVGVNDAIFSAKNGVEQALKKSSSSSSSSPQNISKSI